jgi:asparagine synthase (glutamine-hydrolysing)
LSGFYGIYRYDGAPVDPDWMERMRDAMGFYGPHGGAAMIEKQVAMGHLLLKVNPEDGFEKQPVASGRGLTVSTARLDNRDELLGFFRISSAEAPSISDGQLAALAFEHWGEDVSKHLHGDWALAGWDRRQRSLFLALNATGNATLYYCEGKGYFAFASSLKALLAIPGTGREPDPLRIAQVLVSWQHDAQLTAYKGLRRLIWAHSMTVSADGQLRLWRHWSPLGRDFLSYKRDEEYVEAFLEHYTRAVQSCLRSKKEIAATLSGGRDSGSVVALAAPLLAHQGRSLTAYTSVPCHPPDGAGTRRLGNEWDLAHRTAWMAGDNVRHIPIDAAEYGLVNGIENLLDVHDGPGHAASNHFWIQAIFESAAHSGAGVLLSGQMGNATVSWSGNGSALLALLQGSPQTALRLLCHAEANLWQTIRRQFLKPLFLPGRRLLRRISTPGRSPWRVYSALHPSMAAKLELDGRMRAAGYDPTFTFSPLEDIHLRFFLPGFAVGYGIGSEMAAKYALAYLDPTANLALVEFILRVPDHQFRRRSQGSDLMLRAFRNRLPGPVLEGRRKGLQAADLGYRIRMELPLIRHVLDSLDELPLAGEFLDLPLLRRCLEGIVTSVDPATTADAVSILLRGLGVGLFLRRVAHYRP